MGKKIISMKYKITWQDFLCRWNLWHHYTDWQSDKFSTSDKSFQPVQMRFCFNCHWKKIKRIK